jgi:hypothetical protein
MPKVKVNGVNMYYEVYGEGFPLIMIRGLGANIDWYDPRFIEELSKKFKTQELVLNHPEKVESLSSVLPTVGVRSQFNHLWRYSDTWQPIEAYFPGKK